MNFYSMRDLRTESKTMLYAQGWTWTLDLHKAFISLLFFYGV